VRNGQGRYTIYTTAEDESRILKSPIFRKFRKIIRCDIIRISDEVYKQNPHVTHARLWRSDAKNAARIGAWVCFISPDTFWGNGSLARVGRAFAEGKKVVYGFPMRVIDETVCSELEFRDYGADVELTIEPRTLMEIGLRHLSPLFACYSRHARRFGHHPEYLVYPVPRSGIVFRAIIAHCFAVDPAAVELDEHVSPKKRVPADQIAFLTDSDSFCGLSFTKLLHQVNWFAIQKKHDLVEAAVDWQYYFSPPTADLWRNNFCFYAGTRTEEAWKATQHQADQRELFTYLTWRAVRVHQTLKQCGRELAARLLATAIFTCRLHRYWRERGAITVLVPDEVRLRAMEQKLMRLTSIGNEGALRQFVTDHVILGSLPMKSENNRGEVMTASGRVLQWLRKDNTVKIEGLLVGPALQMEKENDEMIDVFSLNGVISDTGMQAA
jgi:hypothetical protein